VVVYDLYVVSVALPEDKANAPTCVHSHCPLGFAVSLELVQSDTFEWAYVLQGAGDIQRGQQIQRPSKIQASKLTGRFAFPNLTAGGVVPRSDHGNNVLRAADFRNSCRSHT